MLLMKKQEWTRQGISIHRPQSGYDCLNARAFVYMLKTKRGYFLLSLNPPQFKDIGYSWNEIQTIRL